MSRFQSRSKGAEALEMGDDDDFIFYLQKGSQAFTRAAFEDARGALERAFELKPENERAQNMLGLTYFKLGLLEAARILYQRLADAHPEEPSLFVNLGLVLLRQGRLQEAETTLETALRLSPGHKRAHSYLGLVLHRRGDLGRARDHLLLGGASDMVARLDRQSLAAPRPSEMLRAIADEGVSNIDDPGSLRPIVDPVDESGARDEDAWRSQTGHGEAEQLFAPRDDDELSAAEWPKEAPEAATVRITGVVDGNAPLSSAAWSSPPTTTTARLPLVEPAVELIDAPWTDGVAVSASSPKSARLQLRAPGFVRSEAVAFVIGTFESFPTPIPGLLRLTGDLRMSLSFKRSALLVRVDGRLHARTSSMIAIEPGLSAHFDPSNDQVGLEGIGAILLDGPSNPLVVTISPKSPLWCLERAILAYSPELASAAVSFDSRPGVRLSGSGFALLDPSPE
ncbi:MAG: tetratricopeptide repeat protein [Deltaproteobacteria bacterium]|nr:tetratricopeptide repeat protein [Deltaproteobacteria bacterium]